jgi:hypothetical protein
VLSHSSPKPKARVSHSSLHFSSMPFTSSSKLAKQEEMAGSVNVANVCDLFLLQTYVLASTFASLAEHLKQQEYLARVLCRFCRQRIAF